MIAVLRWVDGFGQDTDVVGIFSSVNKAQEILRDVETQLGPLRFVDIDIDELVYLNWYDAKNLFFGTKAVTFKCPQ